MSLQNQPLQSLTVMLLKGGLNMAGEAAGRPQYLRYLLLSLLLIWGVAGLQQHFSLETFHPQFFVLPTLVAVITGLLLARLTYLEAQARHRRDQFQAMADFAMEFTYLRRLDGTYDYVSPSCETITGYLPQEFYAQPSLMDQLIHLDDLDKWNGPGHSLNSTDTPETLEIRIVRKDGEVVWVEHLCCPVFDDNGRQTGVRSTNLDITKRRMAEEDIRRMAFYDPLTDLPNRRSLEVEIRNHIHSSMEGSGFAVLFLDMRRFKNINDSFGHAFGDKLLKEMSARLVNLPEQLYVSRFGGDEFVFIAPGVVNNDDARRLGQLILEAIEQPITIAGVELYLSASLGISFYPRDGEDVDALISAADTAMYRLKGDHDQRVSIYSGVFSDQVSRFVTTEHSIYKGLQERQFVNFYQPKVDLQSERIVGLEALVRWQHPDLGLVLPGEFIDVAEETGQIVELGRMVMEQAVLDLRDWQEQDIAVPVSVNVSARQFTSQIFTEQCVRRFETHQIDPALISLEVTEQVFLGDIDRAKRRLQKFKDKGVSVALDDFGKGYSSLNYLKQLPIDTLKIDRDFIHDISGDSRAQAILKVILGMSHELGLDIVAEGVETEEQRRLLLEMGCRVAQGFYFHHPMPASQIELLLQGQRVGARA